MDARINGAWVTPKTGQAYVNSAWHTLSFAKAYVSGAWRTIVTFVQALTLSVYGGSAKSTSATMSTGASAVPSGGLSPFTYVWSVLSSTNLSNISFSSTTVASPTITATVTSGNPGDSGTATVHCTVTDSLGSTASGQGTASFLIYVPPGGTL